MNIRFRTLIAFALIAVAGIGGVVKPSLSIERAPASALSIERAPLQPTLQFAGTSGNDYLNGTSINPDLQFALQFEGKPGRLTPDLQFS